MEIQPQLQDKGGSFGTGIDLRDMQQRLLSGNPEVVEGAITILKQGVWADNDFRFQMKAVEWLTFAPTDSAIEVMIDVLHRHPHPAVRRSAAARLGYAPGRDDTRSALLEVVHRDGSYVTAGIAARSLACHPTQAILRFFRATLVSPENQLRYAGVRGMGSLVKPRHAPILIPLLHDPEWYVRQAAAEALGKCGSTLAVPALIEALQDSSNSVTMKAAESLGRLKDTRAVEPLGEVVRSNKLDAARALRFIGGQQAAEILLQAWHAPESSHHLRAQALCGLTAIRGAEVLAILLEAVKDESPVVRNDAVRCLGRLGLKDTVDTLIVCLRDPESYVRFNACEALKKIGTPRALAAVAHRRDDCHE